MTEIIVVFVYVLFASSAFFGISSLIATFIRMINYTKNEFYSSYKKIESKIETIEIGMTSLEVKRILTRKCMLAENRFVLVYGYYEPKKTQCIKETRIYLENDKVIRIEK